MAESEWDRIVRRPHPVCAVTGEEFGPSDEIVTVLVFGEGRLERRDVRADAFDRFEGPVYSFWRWKRSDQGERNVNRKLDLGFLSEFFKRLDRETDEHSARVRWIVALLLLRKRVLEIADRKARNGPEELLLRFRGGEDVYRVVDPGLDGESVAAIESDLGRIFNLDPGSGQPSAPPAAEGGGPAA